MTKISQREARALRKRVNEMETVLDRQRNAWADSWPDGVNIATFAVDREINAAIRTARRLNHACVVVLKSDGDIAVFALPIGSKS
jgi:hypothetical protein